MNDLSATKAVDGFAGPGGWDLALKVLGIDPLGIEWDDAACATREAVGLRTLQADIATLNPLDFAPCDLSIGSPPCPTFSRAGKGEGIADMPLVWEAARMVIDGSYRPGLLAWRDVRSELVVEPLRWALALKPRWLAWEQVPDVLPFWEYCAVKLREHGWNVWTGVLEAERYGVAQTRERAILMADRERHVEPPRPTHQRYVKGEPQRHEVTLEGEILPWISMAEALGWGMDARPAGTVVTPRGSGTETGVLDGGSGQRAMMATAKREGGWVYDRRSNSGNGEPVPDREASEPAPTLTAAGLRQQRDRWLLRNGNQPNAAERAADEPAPTVAFGHNAARIEWIYERPAPTIVTTRRSDEGILVERQLPGDEGRNVGGWGWERPATTLQGDPRIFPAGRAERDPSYEAGGEGVSQAGAGGTAVRVTLEEAALLQSFPPDYPFQGSKSKCFEQVGNAVPPLLALAILEALLQRG